MRALKPLSVALVALSGLALGLWAAVQWSTTQTPILHSGILLPTPRPVAPFALTRQDGVAFTEADLRGHWSLLFAGFTYCPDVCPTTLTVMKQVEQGLRDSRRALNAVFVSVDPERDTPEQLSRYVRYYSPTLTGITGPFEQLDRLCASLGIAYIKVPGTLPQNYTVDHSAVLVLVNPQGQVAAYFQPPHRVEALTADLTQMIPETL
ncbi:MAG: SCO family protein [Nevskiales bacterium]|nr:SCO family protein [Nevskiales bacterium]